MLGSWTVSRHSAGDSDHPVSIIQFRERTTRDEEREDQVDKYGSKHQVDEKYFRTVSIKH